MDNKALLNFINEACKQDDSDSIDESIAELTSAIHTLEKEKEKREKKRRAILIDNFRKAYCTLLDNDITLSYLFSGNLIRNSDIKYADTVNLDINDFDCFEFH
jgi:hypothetical protein